MEDSRWRIAILIMLIASHRGEAVLQTDGDAAFWKVNNRLPAHQLPSGVFAEALNLRLDQGNPGPRYGVGIAAWGKVFTNLIPAGSAYPVTPARALSSYVTVTGLVVGQRYFYTAGNSYTLSTAALADQIPSGTQITPGSFIATQTSYLVWGLPAMNGATVTAAVYRHMRTRAYGRFSDPKGFDNAVLVTDEARSDGGTGRAWRILPNNGPQEISLNGHDVWGDAKLVQCYNGLLLLRDGNERHYFNAAAVGTNQITLNCVTAIADGDEVQIVGAQDGSAILGTSAPNLGAVYFARLGGTATLTLYDTRVHAVAGGGTGKLAFASATGSFYLERVSTQAGFYGNGAPVLLLQGSDTQTPFEVGWTAAPALLAVTNTLAAADLLTAVNHRLIPGDAVVFTGTLTGITNGTTYYARPVSNDTFQVFDTVDHALATGATGRIDLSTDGQSGTVKKLNAGGQPIAPGRLGIALLQRAILVNGRCNLLISDPNDPLHFTPMQATLNANLGENDAIVALMAMPYDTLVIVKTNSVLALSHLSETNTNWVLQDITREYGGIASLATASVGSDRWFLSRRGVASIAQTEQGQLQGVALPKSDDIAQRMLQVDWLNAAQACAAEWNNRVFFAVPLKGQDVAVGQSPTNNGTLVYNTVNQGWEDLWVGNADGSNLLTPASFARLTVSGEERLTFATGDGLVCWFTDDFRDADAAGGYTEIATRLVTRGYFGGVPMLALKGELNWDTWNPDLTVSVRTSGVNEEAVILSRTYDKTLYQVAKAGTYDPNTSTEETFLAAHRADYSPAPEELMVATLDTFQNTTEPLRMRVRDRSPQLVIENAQGACRINSVVIAGKPLGAIGTMT